MTKSLSAAVTLFIVALATPGAAVRFPDPAQDIRSVVGEQRAVFAGGCFWGVEGVFERLKGVSNVVSGFAGGSKASAHYEIVSTGMTGHAESVEITYDPKQITYGQLLKVFFAVAHDPTELNRQGPDEGTQYRSMILATSDRQAAIARGYIKQLEDAKIFRGKIVTDVVALRTFYPAEGYHQDYVFLHPNQPYIAINDRPKVENLKKRYPDLYVEKRSAF